jgi:hypothetical protein
MKTILEFLKKYKIYILSGLLVIFLFRSCSKTGQITKLEKTNKSNQVKIDSLTKVLSEQKNQIDNISEVVRREKIKVHTMYDNWISEKDRGEQLMELHKIVKQNLKKLEK